MFHRFLPRLVPGIYCPILFYVHSYRNAAICSDAIRFIGLTEYRQTAIVSISAAGCAR